MCTPTLERVASCGQKDLNSHFFDRGIILFLLEVLSLPTEIKYRQFLWTSLTKIAEQLQDANNINTENKATRQKTRSNIGNINYVTDSRARKSQINKEERGMSALTYLEPFRSSYSSGKDQFQLHPVATYR